MSANHRLTKDVMEAEIRLFAYEGELANEDVNFSVQR